MKEMSYIAATVLHAIRSERRHGFQIMEAVGLASGTVYPALRRLENAGLIRSRWERETVARFHPRPPWRYYQLPREGEAALATAGERFRFPELSAAGRKAES